MRLTNTHTVPHFWIMGSISCHIMRHCLLFGIFFEFPFSFWIFLFFRSGSGDSFHLTPIQNTNISSLRCHFFFSLFFSYRLARQQFRVAYLVYAPPNPLHHHYAAFSLLSPLTTSPRSPTLPFPSLFSHIMVYASSSLFLLASYG